MRLLLAGALVVIAVSACGASSPRAPAPRHRPEVLVVYSSLPLSGPAAAAGRAVERGIALELRRAHRAVGEYRIEYRPLNDAGHRGTWSAARTVANASRAATNPLTAYYIGDLTAAANALSGPILASAGIPQVSPAAPAPGASPSSFVSLAPNAADQARAVDGALRADRCDRVALASARGSGGALRVPLLATAKARHLTVAGVSPVADSVSSLTGYVATLRNLGITCVVYVGAGTKTAQALASLMRADIPHATLLAASSLAVRAPSNTSYGYSAARRFITAVETLGSRAGSRAALARVLSQSRPHHYYQTLLAP